jgi:hypothetical protein
MLNIYYKSQTHKIKQLAANFSKNSKAEAQTNRNYIKPKKQ